MNNLHNHQQQENHKTNGGSHKSTIPHEVNKPFKLHQFSLASGASIVENFLSFNRLPAFLATGFFQVPIRELDKEKTAFYTGSRLIRFTKMPQGFKNSFAIFQRAMQLILKDLLGACCVVYIDDILICGESIEEHNFNLTKVIARIKKYRLEENIEKRIERTESIKFLGYEISYNTVKPSLERAHGIIECKSPESRKDIQRFIGMINYDRQFVQGLSNYLKSLYRLQSKDVKFMLTEIEENILWRLKLNRNKD
ncbi:hypothetical protein NCER_102322 [Vairimorpha ceranae BRL01]|uniref:Reverse transcriptase domain-containing protein n=1 Tax=Vairimorpha ceranae (strain BRL01) TaxID=578460 RepID=C4VBU4_VAIC1|nr:hypothetical protein NCER_102322 [Vairimorpha ceranae BRL01]